MITDINQFTMNDKRNFYWGLKEQLLIGLNSVWLGESGTPKATLLAAIQSGIVTIDQAAEYIRMYMQDELQYDHDGHFWLVDNFISNWLYRSYYSLYRSDVLTLSGGVNGQGGPNDDGSISIVTLDINFNLNLHSFVSVSGVGNFIQTYPKTGNTGIDPAVCWATDSKFFNGILI